MTEAPSGSRPNPEATALFEDGLARYPERRPPSA